jgi:hypothetical protein
MNDWREMLIGELCLISKAENPHLKFFDSVLFSVSALLTTTNLSILKGIFVSPSV